METVIIRALIHQQTLDAELDDHRTRNENLIIQRRKDIFAVNELMERLRGELASSYPCPNPDCRTHNKVPDLTRQEKGQLIWPTCDPNHTNATHKTNNPPPNKSLCKKQTDKDGFPSPSKTKKLKLTDHPQR
ncbi:hypothetical protein TNCT_254561 [Trichonephila clavata]|uniref:Uncharacterized protein n=1 Tax=Trichonephila clavata TaxID=2740835 RepID=A0A8X6L7R3_TRICU|nr:hypothetical protein TNCT_254561 [Trichonephila clavata]